ncbi:MAG TPA: hypothetical protein PLK12_05980 [Prolixibacteraceae bacterium]|nr:hypothetical protein [Prolixibacteraceae bacterium]
MMGPNKRSNQREIRFPTAGKVREIGVVQQGEYPFPVERFQEWGNGITIETFTYIKGKRAGDTGSSVLYDSDLGLFKNPRSKHIRPFVEKAFDILIDASDGSHPALNYICTHSKALFKVSALYRDSRADLIIGLTPDRMDLLPSELKKIITNLKSNDPYAEPV